MQDHSMDNGAWTWGWALGQAATPVGEAVIKGWLSQLFLVEMQPPVGFEQAVASGVLRAYAALPKPDCDAQNAARPGSGSCTNSALTVLQQTLQGTATIPAQPNARFLVNTQNGSADRVEVIVTLDPNVAASLAAPGGPWAEIQVAERPPAGMSPALAKRPSGTTGGLVAGALLGGALGAAIGGGVGGVAGALIGGLVGNQVTKA